MKNLTSKYLNLTYILLAMILVSTSSLANPAKYALLVGISEYHIKPLAGPVNDVLAIRKALMRHWGFQSTNIKVLLNRQATKNNILDNIKILYDKSNPGDEIFIYFSGHGTSASDKNISAPLPTTTGAFIPIDIDNLSNINDLINKLIIGKNDLRPLLNKLDKGMRNVFVAIDACYSGNTVRGIQSERKLPSRFLRIEDLLANRESPTKLSTQKSDDIIKAENEIKADQNENNSYPYKHVFYLSASSEYEPAQDIPPDMLDLFPTIDAKPHGAFTDSLLRVLNNEVNADLNKNGRISYGELKKTLRENMYKRGFNHTPQGLPSLAEDRFNLSGREIFGFTHKLNANQSLTTIENVALHSKAEKRTSDLSKKNVYASDILKIRLDSTLGFLASTLNEQPLLRIVNSHEDINIKNVGNNIILLSSTGDVINSTIDVDRADLINILNFQQWLKKNLNNQDIGDFYVELEYHKSSIGSTLMEDELVGFTIRPSQDASLLLVNIDSNNLASVIFPFEPSEVKVYSGKQLLILKNISRVRAPFGRDIILLYAFDKITDNLQKLRGKEFTLNSPLMNIFERLISNPKINKAKASLVLYTIPRI